MFSGSLRPPPTTHDHSPIKRLLNHDCDTIQHRSCLGHTDWFSDGSETSSDFLGLITDYLRQLWPIFVFFFSVLGRDRSGQTSWDLNKADLILRVPGSLRLYKFGSKEASGSLRLEYLCLGAKEDQLQS